MRLDKVWPKGTAMRITYDTYLHMFVGERAARVENTNWHFVNDGARNGYRVMREVGGRGASSYFWHYTKRRWEVQPS